VSFSLLSFLIILYILSLVCCLAALVVGKIIPMAFSKVAILIHILLLISVVIMAAKYSPAKQPYLFPLFFCSGIICFGLVVRKSFHALIKIYFGIFLLSLLLFLYSPSSMFTVLSMGILHKNSGDEIPLGKNFYLAKQNAMFTGSNVSASYKVIKRAGLFNKTIARDFEFGFSPDSARILQFAENSEISLRIYYKHRINNLAFAVDSIEMTKSIARSANDTLIQIRKNYK
jgi:hypothetical protein